jgi:phenylpropionate dioxygenase-like ring-hydroxylating dioxygenase large terminal subunit
MRVCRADEGNAAAFTCTYHGWTYGNDGKLVGVPGYKEYYYEELDMERWGLIPVAQIDSYRGLIFATFDPEAPPLLEYLGDINFYLDLCIGRRDGGTEIIGGVHKWVMPCNWKIAADNFCGDGYHLQVSHISAMRVGFGGGPGIGRQPGGERFGVDAGNGHAVTLNFTPDINAQPPLDDYLKSIMPEREKQLGALRSGLSTGAGTVFPNFSILISSHTIRVWHPRGPDKTEVWSWGIVDRAAPMDIKEAMRVDYLRRFSMAGSFEQDDGENWNAATAASVGRVARNYPFNYALGIHHEVYREDVPGWLGPKINENQQRGFYRRWAELIQADGSARR